MTLLLLTVRNAGLPTLLVRLPVPPVCSTVAVRWPFVCTTTFVMERYACLPLRILPSPFNLVTIYSNCPSHFLVITCCVTLLFWFCHCGDYRTFHRTHLPRTHLIPFADVYMTGRTGHAAPRHTPPRWRVDYHVHDSRI